MGHSRARHWYVAPAAIGRVLVLLVSVSLAAWAAVEWWPISLLGLPVAALGVFGLLAVTAAKDDD